MPADHVLSNTAAEETLRARLHEDPNDEVAFGRLAEIVRARAAEGHEHTDPRREVDDAVWALAEEMARSQFAWYPLIELARLSIEDDRETALRRLSTAAERDDTGAALASGVAMLREIGHPNDALGLGVGHWRPDEHDSETGRQLVLAALDAHRLGDARRHLEVMRNLPAAKKQKSLIADLERALEKAQRNGPPPTPAFGMPAPPTRPVDPAPGAEVIDVRSDAEAASGAKESVSSRIKKFLHRDRPS